MSFNLLDRSYLRELDFTADEIRYLLDLAADLKAAKRAGIERPRLSGKHIALLFEKASTRTRCAFEVAASDQGAHTTYLGAAESHLGHKESVADTAAVLGRMYDAIEYRGFDQSVVDQLAAHSGVPVYNGLTNQFHPTQSLCDVLTMREHSDKPLTEIAYCYLGDGRNNVANSLLAMGAILGMDVRIAAPRELWPAPDLVARARELAEASGARITITADVAAGVADADFLYTDVWVSMGEAADSWKQRVGQLLPYQVNAKTMAQTGNPRTRFLHCLPAFHNTETEVGEEIYADYGLDALEVTDEVFSGPASLVFEQAENRMHTIKAILVATLGN